MISDPYKFNFVGSILEVMLVKVPSDNVNVNEYCKLPASGAHSMPVELWKAIKEANKPKGGGKWKAKGGPSEVVKTPENKVKKATRKPRSPSLVAQEASETRTQIDFRDDEPVQNEVEDTVSTFVPPTSKLILKVSCDNPKLFPFLLCVFR